MTLRHLTVHQGEANPSNGFFGGNIRSSGTLVLEDSTVTAGSAYSGGGISNNGGTLTLIRSTVSGNTALKGGGDAGAILNFGGTGSARRPSRFTTPRSATTRRTLPAACQPRQRGKRGPIATARSPSTSRDSAAAGRADDRGRKRLRVGRQLDHRQEHIGLPGQPELSADPSIARPASTSRTGRTAASRTRATSRARTPCLGPRTQRGADVDARAPGGKPRDQHRPGRVPGGRPARGSRPQGTEMREGSLRAGGAGCRGDLVRRPARADLARRRPPLSGQLRRGRAECLLRRSHRRLRHLPAGE